MYGYWLGPWQWKEGCYNPPVGSLSGIDLRTVPSQSIPETSNGFGLFKVPNGLKLSSEYQYIGDREKALRLLVPLFTVKADPLGYDAPKPYVGSVLSSRVRDTIRFDFIKLWERSNGAKICLKVLDYLCDFYKVDWREFVVSNLRKHVFGRLPHETTITDNFNRPDSGSLGSSSEGWSWTKLGSGDLAITSNRLAGTGSALNGFARAEIDLSSSDNYAQAIVYSSSTSTTRSCGPCARFDSTDISFYLARQQSSGGANGPFFITKCVTGTLTNLTAGVSRPKDSSLKRIECNGSNLSSYSDGVLAETVVDTSISAGLRTGIAVLPASTFLTFDDFQAGDLGAVSTIVPSVMHQNRMRGM